MVETVKSRFPNLSKLKSASPVILPSLLMCDFGNLENEIRRLEDAGVQGLHLDVMDGHFVPNLSFGLPVVEVIRKITDLPLDVHLMISNPEEYVGRYVEAGANLVSFHLEATPEPVKLFEEIRSAEAAAGIVINPPTPVEELIPVVAECDFVLVMSVMPGFGGQKFDANALEKIRTLREHAGPDLPIEVDGGVNAQTIASCVQAGTDMLVVGSAITSQESYEKSYIELSNLARAAG